MRVMEKAENECIGHRLMMRYLWVKVRLHHTLPRIEILMISLRLKGDYQFDVYRIMRNYNGGAWEDFNPLTNVMVRSFC